MPIILYHLGLMFLISARSLLSAGCHVLSRMLYFFHTHFGFRCWSSQIMPDDDDDVNDTVINLDNNIFVPHAHHYAMPCHAKLYIYGETEPISPPGITASHPQMPPILFPKANYTATSFMYDKQDIHHSRKLSSRRRLTKMSKQTASLKYLQNTALQ